MTSSEEAASLIADIVIWAVFVVELCAKVAISPLKLAYIRQHRIDVIVVPVPFLRPLRILRLFVYGTRTFAGYRRMLDAKVILVYANGVVILSSTVIASIEIGSNPAINSFADSLWWSLVTVTTVGYGDIVPQTVIGRAMRVILMISGVGLFGIVTANLASFLVRTEESKEASLNLLVGKIDALRQEIAELRNESSF